MAQILIVYASAHGTAKSIAERINSQVSAADIGDVTLSSIEENPHLGDFDVIIIGSSIHNRSWLTTASRYVKINALFLKEQPRPTWAFSVGMPKTGAAGLEEERIDKWLKGLIEIKGHKLFEGQWQKGDIPWGFGWMFWLFGAKIEDRRDWDEIDKWADEIVAELRSSKLVSNVRQW
jgi:menaquinone-dependent protoporphyrinogen oxidase